MHDEHVMLMATETEIDPALPKLVERVDLPRSKTDWQQKLRAINANAGS